VPGAGYAAIGAQLGKYGSKAARASRWLTRGSRVSQVLRTTRRVDIALNLAQSGYHGYQGYQNGDPLQFGLSAFGFSANSYTALNRYTQARRRLLRNTAPRGRVVELCAKHGHLSAAQRQARIAERTEANYLRRIKEIEGKYGASNVHGLEKHGAQTTLLSQLRRVSQTPYPNPTNGMRGNATKNASKFLSHRDHYEALEYALRQPISPTGFDKVPVSFDRTVGIKVFNQGTHSNRGPFTVIRGLRNAEVRFKDGKLVSAFPF